MSAARSLAALAARASRRGWRAIAAALLAALAAPLAGAQDYPNKPVRIINDSAAGSANDASARILAD